VRLGILSKILSQFFFLKEMHQSFFVLTLSLFTTTTGLPLLLNSHIQNAQALPPQQNIRLALSPAQVASIAEQISVRIDGQAPGSGVLIAKQGQTYFVLTAAHVVATPDEYDVVTPDGQKYKVNYAQVKKLPGVDLAVVQFTSARNYQVAKLGNSSQLQRGMPAFVAGWPAGGNTITNPTLLFQQGMVSANSQITQADGYGLIYTNNTLPGMSGGPVLNSQGEVIGIHGKGETERQQATRNSEVVVKVGYNLGVPINTFLNLVSKTGLNIPLAAAARPVGIPPKPVANAPSAPKVDDFIAEGSNKLHKGDFTGAIAALDRAISADPNAVDAYLLRAKARIETLGNSVDMRAPQNRAMINAALADADRAIQLAPGSGDAYMYRAWVRTALRNYPEALTDITEALRISPNNASYLTARSCIYSSDNKAGKQNWYAAIADATEALKLEPNSPDASDAYSCRGVAFGYLREFSRFAQDFTQAIQLKPKVPVLYYNRGVARSMMGDLQGALNDMQKAADLAMEQNQTELYELAVKGMRMIRSQMR
jgi:tetratricopeptide (TPR) repeat protein